jgi:Spy/CpxP family protein refolding chaperone
MIRLKETFSMNKVFFAAAAAFVAAVAVAPARAQELGVPACDEFLKKYEACLAKQPEAVRTQGAGAVKQIRQMWGQIAANPQTKPQLEPMCKQTIEQAKPQLNAAPLNCGF